MASEIGSSFQERLRRIKDFWHLLRMSLAVGLMSQHGFPQVGVFRVIAAVAQVFEKLDEQQRLFEPLRGQPLQSFFHLLNQCLWYYHCYPLIQRTFNQAGTDSSWGTSAGFSMVSLRVKVNPSWSVSTMTQSPEWNSPRKSRTESGLSTYF